MGINNPIVFLLINFGGQLVRMMIITDLNNAHFPSEVFRIIVGKIEVPIILSYISNNYSSLFLMPWKCVCVFILCKFYIK